MPEEYKVNNGACTVTSTKITMPVTPVNNPPTPVYKIIGRPGNQDSWERETSNPNSRYADIYFNSQQFNSLSNNVNASNTTVRIRYNAPAISGDDRITGVTVLVSHP